MPEKKFYTSTKSEMFDNIFFRQYNDLNLFNYLLSKILGKKVEAINIMSPLKDKDGPTKYSSRLKIETAEETIDFIINPMEKISVPQIMHLWHNYKKNREYKDKKYIIIHITENILECAEACGKYKISSELDGDDGELYVYEYNLDRIVKEVKSAEDEYSYIAMLNSDKENLEKICAGDKYMEEYKDKAIKLNENEDFVELMQKSEKLIINIDANSFLV